MSEGVLEKTLEQMKSTKGLPPEAMELYGELNHLREKLILIRTSLLDARLISVVKARFQSIDKGLVALDGELRKLNESAGEVAKGAGERAEELHQRGLLPTRIERQTLFDHFGARKPPNIIEISFPKSDIAKIEVLAR